MKKIEIELEEYDYSIMQDVAKRLQVDMRGVLNGFVGELLEEFYEEELRRADEYERDWSDMHRDMELERNYQSQKEVMEELYGE